MGAPSASGLPAGQRLFDALLACGGPVLLTGPIGPDGDSLGACLALASVLEKHGVRATVAATAAARYRPLPHFDRIVPDTELPELSWAAVVVLDGDRHRLTAPVARAFAGAGLRGIVDHHRSTAADGYDHAWLDARASSACEMLCELFEARSTPLDADIAALLYAGIAFDTGTFRYSNATPTTLRRAAYLMEQGFDHAGLVATMLMERRWEALQLAAEVYQRCERVCDGRVALARIPCADHERLGLVAGDLEGLVDNLVHIAGVDVACLLIDVPGGGMRLSLRSRGPVDVAAIAEAVSPTGGGHAKAAGALLEGEPDALEVAVRERVVALVPGYPRPQAPG